MNYLFSRVRRELEERWSIPGHANRQRARQAESRVLLIDFAGSDLQLGGAETVLRRSILDSQAANEAYFQGHESGSFDGVIMCLQLAWLELETVLTEIFRLLRPGGKLLFCTFGPDTLQQLRWAWNQVDQLPHVHPFVDLHNIGDLLLQSGFASPIVDADWVTVEYGDANVIHADLRRQGLVNILSDRRKTLTGKGRYEKYCEKLEGLHDPGESLNITYELIYGVATVPENGVRIDFEAKRDQTLFSS